jgi:hypothetical protein
MVIRCCWEIDQFADAESTPVSWQMPCFLRRERPLPPIFAVPGRAEIMQTVRKLAIRVETVDQIAGLGIKLNFERSEASIFEAEGEARTRSSDFSHSLHAVER